MSSEVFDNNWIEEMRSKMGNRPWNQQSFPFRIATDPRLSKLRADIEGLLSLVPKHHRKKVIGSLRSDRSFTETHHELRVGQLLVERGLKVEYEKSIDGKTPDWHASTSGGVTFIVEVLTANVSEEERKRGNLSRDLTRRIEGIPRDFVLVINEPRRRVELSHGLNKAIAADVREWLMGNPSVGSALESNGFKFQVWDRGSRNRKVRYFHTKPFRVVNDKPLRENLQSKARKYERIALEHHLPLVVAVKADISAGYDLETLEDLLFGEQQIVLQAGESSEEPHVESVTRSANGLFASMPALSGVIWLRGSNGEDFEMSLTTNPSALCPLSAGIL